MREKINTIFNFLALTHLGIVLIVCLFSTVMLSIFRLNVDLHLSKVNLSPSLISGQLFGTDYLGRDIFALLLNGAKYSISISLFSATLATFIGIVLGTLGGFFGDNKIKVRRVSLLVSLGLLPLVIHYLNLSTKLGIFNGLVFLFFIITSTVLLGYLLVNVLSIFPLLHKQVALPVDFLNMKFIEIIFAIPTYFVLLAMSGIFDPSIYSLIIIIGITSWPRTALLVRTEMLNIREMDFVHSLKLTGIRWYQILIRHAIPNAISPVIINFVFFTSGLLVVESTLSFIGIGLPGDIISWGKILAGFKHNSGNWWTALFPGMIIFFTILSLHRVGRMIKS
ncbi:MAG: ABC transporter permease [Cyclobacteriaceae bacterium]|jgi:peptide/nickel transport system permease protein|nr:ABC transporter permease [Cyclobacteriaceae bacterium]